MGLTGAPFCEIYLEKLGYSGLHVSMALEGHVPILGAPRQFFANFAHSFLYMGLCKKIGDFALKLSVWMES